MAGEETTIINLDGKHNSLVDINGINTFFKSLVVITPSEDDASTKYKVGIASQEELDQGDDIRTKEVSGTYSTTVTKDAGDFQNLFLFLQSASEMQNITISITTIPIEPVQSLPQQQVQTLPEQSTTFYIKISTAILIVLVGIVMLQKFYKQQ